MFSEQAEIVYEFTRFLRKQLNPKLYGKESVRDLLTLVKDTVIIESSKNVLQCQLPEDVENGGTFVKLVERCRRERQRRIDAGEETSRLHFSPMLIEGANGPELCDRTSHR